MSVRYGLSYAAIFFVIGVFGPFFPLFLRGQGFDAAAIGFLIALGGPARVIAGPLMGWVADAGVAVRMIVGAGHVAAALLVVFMLGVHSLLPMAVLVAAAAALHGPLSAMVDASVSHAMRQRAALNYARIRLWGSVAFIGGNIAGGISADVLPHQYIAWLIALGMLAGAGASLVLPNEKKSHTVHGAVQETVAARGIFIAALIAAVAAIQASHAAIYTISAMAWGAQGISQTMTGLLWTLGIITEIVLFFRIGNAVSGLRRALLFIALGGALALLRWLIMAAQPGLPLTMLCQLVHGLTFGATHLGMIAALAELSPSPVRARIQGASAAMQALATSVAIFASGHLYQRGGASAAYALMAAYAACGLALTAVLIAIERRRNGAPPRA